MNALRFVTGARALGLVAVLALSLGMKAAPEAAAPTAPVAGRSCPDPSKLRGICIDVYRKSTDNSSPGNYMYTYERKIYDAACVDFETDTQQSARAKLREMWISQRHRLTCDGSNFNVANGGILKYAIATEAFNLIDQAARYWGVDLNLVDQADGATVLDYMSDRIRENRGNPLEPRLNDYYNILRRYGARHCRELPDTSTCSQKELARILPRLNSDGSIQRSTGSSDQPQHQPA